MSGNETPIETMEANLSLTREMLEQARPQCDSFLQEHTGMFFHLVTFISCLGLSF